MKKILLAAVAALAIVGCTQNEEIENVGNKAEINFKTVVSKTTRVTPMVTDNFATFKVNAYNTEATEMGTEVSLTTSFMDETVEKKSGTWGVKSNNEYYWPMTGNIQFFAYSPATNVTSYTAVKGYPTFSYTVQPVATQEDLLVAKAENTTKAKNGTNGVSLAFAHILTQINFSAKLEADATYTVTKIEISGANETGTFTYGAAALTGVWTATSGVASYVYSGKYDAVAAENVVSFSTGANALMLLPQTLSADAKISITYSVVKGGTTTFSGIKEVSLSGQKWEIGKNLRYTLELSSDATAVTFKPTVNEWGTEEPGAITPPAK